MKLITLIFLIIPLSISIYSKNEKKSQNCTFLKIETIKQWNYNVKKCLNPAQKDWEKKFFGEAKIELVKVKSIYQVKNWKNTYYRYNLIKESYPNIKTAKKRFKNLRYIPKNINSKRYPSLILRDGFRSKNIVYIISTDVVAFSEKEMQNVLKKFKKYILKKN